MILILYQHPYFGWWVMIFWQKFARWMIIFSLSSPKYGCWVIIIWLKFYYHPNLGDEIFWGFITQNGWWILDSSPKMGDESWIHHPCWVRLLYNYRPKLPSWVMMSKVVSPSRCVYIIIITISHGRVHTA